MQWQDQTPDFQRRPAVNIFLKRTLMETIEILCFCAGESGVLLETTVWEQIQSHLKSSRVELGGLLLGHVFEHLWDNTKWISCVSACVAADEYDATGVSLRMSSQIWERARDLGARGGHTVIGWYHSHPDLGVFFSGTDRLTQRNFFREEHSLGLVVDPVRDQQKWFVGPTAIELPDARIRLF